MSRHWPSGGGPPCQCNALLIESSLPHVAGPPWLYNFVGKTEQVNRLYGGLEPCHTIAWQALFFGVQLLHPRVPLVRAALDTDANRLGHRLKDCPDITDQVLRDAAILANATAIHRDLDHGG